MKKILSLDIPYIKAVANGYRNENPKSITIAKKLTLRFTTVKHGYKDYNLYISIYYRKNFIYALEPIYVFDMTTAHVVLEHINKKLEPWFKLNKQEINGYIKIHRIIYRSNSWL